MSNSNNERTPETHPYRRRVHLHDAGNHSIETHDTDLDPEPESVLCHCQARSVSCEEATPGTWYCPAGAHEIVVSGETVTCACGAETDETVVHSERRDRGLPPE